MNYIPLQSNPEYRENLERAARNGEIDKVQAAKETIFSRAENLLAIASNEGRDLTAKENHLYQEMLADIEFVNQVIGKTSHKVRQLNAFSNVHRAGGMSENRSVEWQKILNREAGTYEIPLGQVMQRLQNKSAFERRDILTTTATLIPTQILDELTTRLQQASGVLAANPRIINTEGQGGYTLKANQISTLGTASVISEGGAFSESDPTVTTVTFQAFKFGRLSQVSNELLADAFFDLERYLGDELSVSLGQTIAPVLVTGSGTATAQGILNNVTTGVTGGTALTGAPTYANVIGLYGSLPTQYLTNSSWLMNPSTFTALAQLLDTQNRSLLLPSLSGDAPTTLLGRPVYLDSNMPATGLGAKSIWFGDMNSFYTVRFAERLTIDVSRDFAFANDLTTYRIKQRLDGRIVDTNAARVFVGAAS
jgi:HK97 family phage major capsid protein